MVSWDTVAFRTGIGQTVTLKKTGPPVSAPFLGITLYTTFPVLELELFVNVWEILPVPLLLYPEIFDDADVTVQLYVVPGKSDCNTIVNDWPEHIVVSVFVFVMVGTARIDDSTSE